MTDNVVSQDEIIRQNEVLEMARQAVSEKHEKEFGTWFSWKEIEAFAKLVDAKATAKEREACHALRQTLQNPYTHCQVSAHACDMAYVEYGKAIRARGEA